MTRNHVFPMVSCRFWCFLVFSLIYLFSWGVRWPARPGPATEKPRNTKKSNKNKRNDQEPCNSEEFLTSPWFDFVCSLNLLFSFVFRWPARPRPGPATEQPRKTEQSRKTHGKIKEITRNHIFAHVSCHFLCFSVCLL